MSLTRIIVWFFFVALCIGGTSCKPGTDAEKSFQLTTSVSPENSGTVSPEEGVFEEGEHIEITATPAKGYVFEKWASNVLARSENPFSVEISHDIHLNAIFKKKSYPLEVAKDGLGEVSEQVVQAKSTDYEYGTVVQLTAEPDQGWEFQQWSGDLSGSENPATIMVDTSKQVTALFEKVASEISGKVYDVFDGDTTYIKGATVKIGDNISETDGEGAFTIWAPLGNTEIEIIAEYFNEYQQTIDVTEGATYRFDIEPDPAFDMEFFPLALNNYWEYDWKYVFYYYSDKKKVYIENHSGVKKQKIYKVESDGADSLFYFDIYFQKIEKDNDEQPVDTTIIADTAIVRKKPDNKLVIESEATPYLGMSKGGIGAPGRPSNWSLNLYTKYPKYVLSNILDEQGLLVGMLIPVPYLKQIYIKENVGVIKQELDYDRTEVENEIYNLTTYTIN